ncbi:MAG: ABC transporter substrate-binding protein [Rhodovarius sp.]|nr:ABC transporter substrate-binding protein [Rhodovarius sp.]MCX7931484.1 ABC transporter substrate-binding protein [Rhodovarius sp.]MDW8314956.1 ABC transporter substrate-binding protein [Rhodovarius sp.]
MQRRALLALGAAAALPAPAIAQPASNRVLKFVPQANLTSVDPIWTTATVTRNHGYLVYDCLYGLDDQFRPHPQMAEGTLFDDGGKIATITLRPGLFFHDGEPVRATDVVASLNRWMARSPIGQKLRSYTEELEALDDRRLRFRLNKPFPLLLHALGSVATPTPFIMPERIARTDPFQQIRETVGSGPFRFVQSEFNSGSLAVYVRNERYVPNPNAGPVSLTAGPKVVHFDRLEWHIIQDTATSTAALMQGEIDWFEQPTPENQLLLRRNRNVVVELMTPFMSLGIMRFNFLHPPFDNPAMRRALLPAIQQSDFMIAAQGPDPANWRDGVGIFTPGSPLASDAGLEPLRGPRSIERARQLMREAGYTNQLIRILGPTDILNPAALTQVTIDLFRRLGANIDPVLTDWGTVVQRRASREPLERGGWSITCTTFAGFEVMDPAGHFPLRGNGRNAWFGWPDIPRLEELRDAWFDAPDLPTQQALAREMQIVAMHELPFIPLGAVASITALRRNLTGRVPGFAQFWNIRRA